MKLLLSIEFEYGISLNVENPAYVPSVGHIIYHRCEKHRVTEIRHSFDNQNDEQVIYVITETLAN